MKAKETSPFLHRKNVIIYQVFRYFVIVHVMSDKTNQMMFRESINYTSLIDHDNSKEMPLYALNRIL